MFSYNKLLFVVHLKKKPKTYFKNKQDVLTFLKGKLLYVLYLGEGLFF